MNDTQDNAAAERKAPDRMKRLLRDLSPAGIRRRALNLCSGTPAPRKRAVAAQGHVDSPRTFAVLKDGPTELCAWFLREAGPPRTLLPPGLAEPIEYEKVKLLRACRLDRLAWERQAEQERADARRRRQDEPPDDPNWPRAIEVGYGAVYDFNPPPRWHRDAATEPQIACLRRGGLCPPPGITKGLASWAIDMLMRGEFNKHEREKEDNDR